MSLIDNAVLGTIFTIGSIGILIGVPLGYLFRKKVANIQAGTVENKLQKLIEDSKAEAKNIVLSAKEEGVRILEEVKKEEKEREVQLSKHEERISNREDFLDKKVGEYDRLERELTVKAEKLHEFYRTYYQPSNAAIVVAGDFDPDSTFRTIRSHMRHFSMVLTFSTSSR